MELMFAKNLMFTFPIKKMVNAPVLFLVHGGAWMSGDKTSARMVVNKVNYWAEKGFIVVSTGYRLAPHVSINNQLKDVIQAINRAQSTAHELGGDKNKFILVRRKTPSFRSGITSCNHKWHLQAAQTFGLL